MKKKQPKKKANPVGRPAFRNYENTPAAALNTAEGKTRHSYILKIESINILAALAKAEGNTLGTQLEICIGDRVKRYEAKNDKLPRL